MLGVRDQVSALEGRHTIAWGGAIAEPQEISRPKTALEGRQMIDDGAGCYLCYL